MSRQVNQPMQNGMPPQWGAPPQKSPNYAPGPLNNGVGSSQSSRDSSPMSRLGGIPASQLPPGLKGANGPPVSTPHSSPRMATSTPINNSAAAAGEVNKHTVRNPMQMKHNLNQPFEQNQIPTAATSLTTPNNPHYPPSTVPNMPPPPNLQKYPPTPQFNPSNQSMEFATPVNQQQQRYQPPQQIRPFQNMEFTPPVQNNQQQAPQRYSPSQQQTVRPFNSPNLNETMEFTPPVANSHQPKYPPSPQQHQQPAVQQQPKYPPSPQQIQQPSVQQQPKYPPSPQQIQQPPIQQQSKYPPSPQQIQQPSVQQQPKYPPSPQQIQQPSVQQQPKYPPSPQQIQQPSVQQQPKYPPSPQQQPIPQNVPFPPQNSMPHPMPTQFATNSFPAQQQQQQVRPPSGAQFNAPPTSNAPQTNAGSNLHSKRYPQPQAQNQNFPQYPQQNANIPPTPIPSNTYNNQQQYSQSNQQQPTNAYYQQQQQQKNYQNLPQQMQNMNIVKGGFTKGWGNDNYDLLQCPNVLPEEQVQLPKVSLGQEFLDNANCSSEIFRCTMTKIPESNSLLQKSRLPLGVLIHPFKDLNHLPVISCNTIVRCRACRTYINPFIFFVDTKRWKCNLCYRVNELPEEFQYDPVSKTYGDPSRRPEIKSSTIEYIAPSEYMLRPPQPAVYLFLLDISRLAIESGYLHTVCEVLAAQLSTLPGDARTQIGFLAYNSTLHFFSLAEGLNQPHEMIVSDIDDVFLPCPDNLLVNLKEHMDLVTDLLTQLPTRYQNSFDGGSALGCALQAAFKLMGATGGRVTVFQAALPQLGPGGLTAREDPNQRAGKEAPHLNPATDFYKRLALDCSGHQVAVDLFLLNSQYVDVATLSGISRFSGGCMHHFPLYKANNPTHSSSLERCFRRYLTRKIGFEAVMRIRCTRGLAIHTFHGNFFVRSTDLLSLPNVNPDAGFGMQVAIEESLTDLQSVCFQAALLYTSSKGERRIRVHTLCLPVVSTLSDVLNSADQQCIVGILSKMAVDRSLQSSLSDARDAFINVAIDILSSYKLSLNMGNSNSGILAPQSLKLLPLYILALLKCTAFRTGQSTRLDDRVFAMCDMKTLPLPQLMQIVYPDLYPIYRLAECPTEVETDGTVIPKPRRLQLTARNIDSHGAYLLDAGQQMIIFVCQNVSQQFLVHSLGVPNYNSIPDQCFELQKISNTDNEILHAFINRLNDDKPYAASLQIMRENSPSRGLLMERLLEDRIEFALSYNEFLQHLKTQVK